MKAIHEANNNLTGLAVNDYPGRGIVLGTSENERHRVQVYWIMGRSKTSRDRRFARSNGRLFTETASSEPETVDPLTIYSAMREQGEYFLVSNGAQTDALADGVVSGKSFQQVLDGYQYEPDEPNFTPRISGYCCLDARKPAAALSILKRSRWNGSCDRALFEYETIGAGFGYCITTYAGNGAPLPAYRGEPFLVPVHGGVREVAETFWQHLNLKNRVALAAKFIHSASGESETHIINQY